MYNLGSELEKLKELGVAVSVKLRAQEKKLSAPSAKLAVLEKDLQPEKDGLIVVSDKDEPLAFAIVITIPRVSYLGVAIVEGQKKQVRRLSGVGGEGGEGQIFVRLVSTHDVYGGWSTMPRDNSVRVVCTQGGRLRIFSVAVVTRIYMAGGAHYFLVVQEMYSAQLYLDGERIVADERVVTDEDEYGGFNRWEGMRRFVDPMVDKSILTPLPKNLGEIPVVGRRRTETESRDGEGQVIFYDVNKGWGFAQTPRGPCYFHWKQTTLKERLPYFQAGQRISYRGTEAVDIKGNRLIGVEVTR